MKRGGGKLQLVTYFPMVAMSWELPLNHTGKSAGILTRATTLFGSQAAAEQWLEQPRSVSTNGARSIS